MWREFIWPRTSSIDKILCTSNEPSCSTAQNEGKLINHRVPTGISRPKLLFGDLPGNWTMQVTEFHSSEPILIMSGHTLSVVLKSHVVLIGAVGSEGDR